MWFKALNVAAGETFAYALANELLAELGNASEHGSKKFRDKAGKVLSRAERRVSTFKLKQPQNWYQRSRCSNAFLWALKDAGCPADYAEELTQWFVAHL